MQITRSIVTHSGYAILFDPDAVQLEGREADLEYLQQSSAEGATLFWPALDDETTILVLADEPLPIEIASAQIEASTYLRVPSGVLWLTDPAYLHERAPSAPIPETAGVRLEVNPGRYAATVRLLDWPDAELDSELRRAAGTVATAIRDVLGIFTFLLGAATVIGLPVFLLGRALDAGLAGVGEGLGLALPILVPLWIGVVLVARTTLVRRVDRADAKLALRYPDAVVELQSQPGDDGDDVA
ncbi:MAG TPA: hypothetical protein VF071_05665 [Candidatus Limnocylindria bacterium]